MLQSPSESPIWERDDLPGRRDRQRHVMTNHDHEMSTRLMPVLEDDVLLFEAAEDSDEATCEVTNILKSSDQDCFLGDTRIPQWPTRRLQRHCRVPQGKAKEVPGKCRFSDSGWKPWKPGSISGFPSFALKWALGRRLSD